MKIKEKLVFANNTIKVIHILFKRMSYKFKSQQFKRITAYLSGKKFVLWFKVNDIFMQYLYFINIKKTLFLQ